jgi:aspartate-semialdehyde dehydrogenase
MNAATSRELKVAVVGATGAVGGQIVELLGVRGLSIVELGLFATAQGAAQTVEALGSERRVEELHEPAELSSYDIAFLAVAPSWAAEIVRARPGPVLIDLSAATRARSGVAPFVAPGFTPPERVAQLARTDGVLAIAHPASHVLASVVNAAGAKAGTVCVTLMVGASSVGRQSVEEVAREAAALLSGTHSLEEGDVQRAFNAFRAESATELAGVLAAQTQALIGSAPRFLIEVVNVAVLHGSALTVFIPDPPDTQNLTANLQNAPGLVVLEGEEEGASVADAIGQEAVLVVVNLHPAGAVVWCAFDGPRAAALDAVWAAEKLVGAYDSDVE